MRKSILLFALMLGATAAQAQLLPFLSKYPTANAPAQPLPPQAPGMQQPVDMLRADFAAQSGGSTVYFLSGSADLGQQARAILTGQAAWLRRHPDVAVRIEGHGDSNDTRDHALALGAERAAQARDYLLLLGIPAAQVSAITWGKERPGAPRAVTVIAP